MRTSLSPSNQAHLREQLQLLQAKRQRQAAWFDAYEEAVLDLFFAEAQPPLATDLQLLGLKALLDLYQARCRLLGLEAAAAINAPLRGRAISLTELVNQTLAATA